MMIFDPPGTWWIRVGKATAYRLTEASTEDILAELEEIRLRNDGYASQRVQPPPMLFSEFLALMIELTTRR